MRALRQVQTSLAASLSLLRLFERRDGITAQSSTSSTGEEVATEGARRRFDSSTPPKRAVRSADRRFCEDAPVGPDCGTESARTVAEEPPTRCRLAYPAARCTDRSSRRPAWRAAPGSRAPRRRAAHSSSAKRRGVRTWRDRRRSARPPSRLRRSRRSRRRADPAPWCRTARSRLTHVSRWSPVASGDPATSPRISTGSRRTARRARVGRRCRSTIFSSVSLSLRRLLRFRTVSYYARSILRRLSIVRSRRPSYLDHGFGRWF